MHRVRRCTSNAESTAPWLPIMSCGGVGHKGGQLTWHMYQSLAAADALSPHKQDPFLPITCCGIFHRSGVPTPTPTLTPPTHSHHNHHCYRTTPAHITATNTNTTAATPPPGLTPQPPAAASGGGGLGGREGVAAPRWACWAARLLPHPHAVHAVPLPLPCNRSQMQLCPAGGGVGWGEHFSPHMKAHVVCV